VVQVFVAQRHEDHLVPMLLGDKLGPHQGLLSTDGFDDLLVGESEGLEQSLRRPIRLPLVIDGIRCHVAEAAERVGDSADDDHRGPEVIDALSQRKSRRGSIPVTQTFSRLAPRPTRRSS
jgi:hypothetical protein